MWWKKERRFNLNFFIIGITVVLIIFGVSKIDKPSETKNYFTGEINGFCLNDGCVEKDGEKWWYRQGNIKQPAKKSEVEDYLKKIALIKLGQVVSTNKEKEKIYGFDDNQFILKVNNQSLIIGRVNNDYSGTFVKKSDTDNIYSINVVLNKISLIDLTITNWPTDKITKVMASNGVRKTSINVKDKIFINKMANLSGINYWPSIDKNKAKAIKFIINDGEYSLIIGQLNNLYFATADESNYFEITSPDYFALKSKLR